MISLVGEQPIPNLLPILYLKPHQIVFVRTGHTRKVCERLEPLLEKKPEGLDVDPYDIGATQQVLREFILGKGWPREQLIFNLTGGTKPMAFAAYRLAEELRSSFLYLQSEGGKSLIYRYQPGEQGVLKTEVPPVLTIDRYLRAHLGKYELGSMREEPRSPGEGFERCVYESLLPDVDEIKASVKHGGSLEIDLVLRCGNQIGIAEVKSGRKAQGKEGIDQLNTAAEQRYLGTYASKFLIVDRPLVPDNQALANAHRIEIIELLSAGTGNLSDEDKKKLSSTICKVLKGGNQ